MTVYRKISDTEVQIDAPLTQQLFKALRDNVLAYIEGDASLSNTATGEGIRYTAFQSQTIPQAGYVVVAQVVGHFSADDTSGIAIYIRRAGTFRVRLEMTQERSTDVGSKDGNVNEAQTTGLVRLNRGGAFSDIGSTITASSHSISGMKVMDEFDHVFQKDDVAFVKIDETDLHAEATAVLTLSVADTNAIYGCDAIGKIT